MHTEMLSSALCPFIVHRHSDKQLAREIRFSLFLPSFFRKSRRAQIFDVFAFSTHYCLTRALSHKFSNLILAGTHIGINVISCILQALAAFAGALFALQIQKMLTTVIQRNYMEV